MNEQFRVLLIEDNPALLRMIADMLGQSSGAVFFVELASRLTDGMERLSDGGIDVVLLDLTLPDSKGLDTFLQCYNRNPDVPVVVLTALEDEDLALTAIRSGAQDYLIKGEIHARALIRSIRYAIERKRGEEARSRLAAIVESSHDAIIGLSLEGLIVSWNTGAEAIFGYSFEEVIGRPSSALLARSQPDEMTGILKQLKAGHFVRDFEALRHTKVGCDVHVAVSVSPIKNSFGRIIGASMIARNINDQKQHEAEREQLIGELQSALMHVQTLSGLLPICASCKKIRDDQGYWTQVEVYLTARSQAEFTHGICPECEQQYRAQLPRPAPGPVQPDSTKDL
jgi:PAS domain S-box-containing protein